MPVNVTVRQGAACAVGTPADAIENSFIRDPQVTRAIDKVRSRKNATSFYVRFPLWFFFDWWLSNTLVRGAIFSVLLNPRVRRQCYVLRLAYARCKPQSQNGSTWMRFPSRRVSDVPTSLSCKSSVLTLATPVNSLSPGPGTMCIRVLVLPIHFLFSSNRNAI